VITEKAPPVTALRETVPAHVAAVIGKALNKLPADRFASASAFAAALSTPGFQSTAVAGAAAMPPVRPAGRTMTVALTVALAVVGGFAVAGWLKALARPSVPVQRFELAVDREFGVPPAFGTPLAISPDGQQYVFVGPGDRGRQLWLRSMDRLEPVPLGGTDGAMSPRFSPDGRWIAFTAEQRLRKVPVTGGSPITLADSANSTLSGVAWLDDGTLLFVHGDWGIYRMPAAGGDVDPVVLIDSAGGGGFFFPDGLPGSKRALVTKCSASCGTMDIATVDLADGELRVLIEDAARAWYLPTGHLAYADREGSVFAAPFDAGRAAITGPAVPVAEGVRMQVRIVPEMEISPSGYLLYRSGGGGEMQLAWVDRRGQMTDVDPEWTGFFGSPELSPSGDRAAVALTVDGSQDIWVKILDKGPASRLSFEGEVNERPVWSPDGRRVGYISNRSGAVGPKRAVARRADGGGQDEVLLEHQLGVEQVLWSRDGKWLVARVGGSDGVRDIVGQRLGVDTVPQPLVATPADEYAPALSPDDRFLAYVSTESGQPEVFVVPFPDTEDARWQVSVRGGSSPVWAPDGSHLYYLDGTRNLVAVSVTERGTLAIGRQEILFPAPSFNVDVYHPAFSIEPSGDRFLVANSSGATGGSLNLILVQNWFEEIRSRSQGRP
jgi:serine/threonine-protein kinase